MAAQGFVQAVSGSANMVASGSVCSVVNSAAPHLLSDFILAVVVSGPLVSGSGFASINNVQDIANGPYTYLAGITNGMNTLRHSLYYWQNSAPCAQNANKITVNFSAPSTNIYVRFVEFSGIVISGQPVDIAANAIGNNTPPIIGPITPHLGSDLLFSCCSILSGGSPMTGVGSGWTLAGLDNIGNVDQFILNAPVQSYTGTFAGPNPNSWVTTLVGFINAGQGGAQLATVNIATGLAMPVSSKLQYGGIGSMQPRMSMTPTAKVMISAIANLF